MSTFEFLLIYSDITFRIPCLYLLDSEIPIKSCSKWNNDNGKKMDYKSLISIHLYWFLKEVISTPNIYPLLPTTLTNWHLEAQSVLS